MRVRGPRCNRGTPTVFLAGVVLGAAAERRQEIARSVSSGPHPGLARVRLIVPGADAPGYFLASLRDSQNVGKNRAARLRGLATFPDVLRRRLRSNWPILQHQVLNGVADIPFAAAEPGQLYRDNRNDALLPGKDWRGTCVRAGIGLQWQTLVH